MMKNLRVFFPIVLLVLLTIVLSSCQSVVPSPGATDNELMIRGKIKMPFTCCTIEEPIFEDETGHYTDSWSVIPEAVVELKDLDDCNNVLSTTFADEDGYYEFDDVEPGIYIVTAYCPVPGQKNYVFKDVVVKEDGEFNYAGIPDCDSTSLALILEYLNDCFKNTTCFKMNSDIHRLVKSISADISDMSVLDIIEEAELGTLHEDFGNFIDADDEDLVDLVCNQLMGCCIGPGFTPQPGPPPAVVTYSLTLGVNPEGAGTASGAGDYNANSTANISASANEGWQFVNWTGDATGTNPGTSVLMNGNKSATANFEEIPTYAVTYDANGGTGSQTDPNSPYYEGETVTVLGLGSISRENYTFSHWNTAANGSGTSYDPAATFAMGTSDVTLYAQWTEDDKYTVTYDANGGTGAPTDPASPYYEGETVTVVSGEPTKANYTFTGWLYDSTTYIAGDDFTMPAANVTLVAQWTENDKYNVYYDANTGTGTQTDNNDYYEGDTVTVLDEGTMAKTNYTFSHWNTAADDSGTSYDPAATFPMGTSDVTLYAQWTEDDKYTVTYDGNGNDGGTVPDDSNLYYAGDTVTVLGNTGALFKSGYTFDGWNTESDGTGDNYIAGNTFDMPAKNVTLYAKWEPIDYYVYYYGNGNTSGSAPIDGFNPYNVGDTVYVLGNTGNLAKTGGYTFDGWNTESDGTGTSYSAGDTFSMPAYDVELYAQWICNPCSGWDATGVTVYLWYAGSHGHSDPRIDVDGAITGPSCADITEVNIQFYLYNKGEHTQESFTDTVTSVNNSFSVELDIDPAKYNSGDTYELYVSIPNCGLILVKSGEI